MEFENLVKFSFSWLKNSMKYVFAIWIAYIVFFIALTGTALAFFGLSFLSNPSIGQEFFQKLAGAILPFLFLAIIEFTLFVAVLTFISIKAQARALSIKGLSTTAVDFGIFVKIIVLQAYISIKSFFWPHNKTLRTMELALVIASILLIFAGVLLIAFKNLIGIIAILFALLLFFPWMAIAVYCSFRYSIALSVFLSKKNGIRESSFESWKLTHGKILNIFIAGLLLGIVQLIIGFALDLAVMLVLLPIQMLMGGNAMLPAIIIRLGSNLLFSPIGLLSQSFFAAGLYFEILKESANQATQS